MGPIRRGVIAVSLVTVVAIAALVLLDDRSAQLSAPLVGRVAPAIHGRTLDGDAFDPSDARGGWLLVNFFAPWCAECAVEHPELSDLVGRHRDVGDLRVVSVVVDSERDAVDRFLADRRSGWTFVMDPSGRTAVDYGQLKVPESYLVSPAGIVVTKFFGPVTADDVDASILGGS